MPDYPAWHIALQIIRPLVAYIFHFPPSEMWEWDVDELHFWYVQACQIAESMQQA